MADSREHRDHIKAAVRLGISPKRLDGWEPREVTVHHRNRRGQITRSVTTREAEWDPHQRGLVLALQMYESLVHGPCGHYLPDSTAADADGRYHVDAPTRCHACTAQARAFKQHLDSPHDAHPEALLWHAERR